VFQAAKGDCPLQPTKPTPTHGMKPQQPRPPARQNENAPALEGNAPTAEGFEAKIVQLDHTSAEQLFRKARL
ncbi:MAG TPA: hypothetical protein VKQ36_14690, partial [Ktedonobacterales bacterium]|nr:hypothetical protein [Ktedonobacterales bacterium]